MFYMHPTVYPVGKTNLSFECRSRVIIFRVWEHRNASLKLQLRNHSNDNWTSVFELNGANEFKENKLKCIFRWLYCFIIKLDKRDTCIFK